MHSSIVYRVHAVVRGREREVATYAPRSAQTARLEQKSLGRQTFLHSVAQDSSSLLPRGSAGKQTHTTHGTLAQSVPQYSRDHLVRTSPMIFTIMQTFR